MAIGNKTGTHPALQVGAMRNDLRSALDPVCGREVDREDPRLQSEYADVVYQFCSQQCMDRFIEQPDIFTADPGRGRVAENDRALRDDAHEGDLAPDARPINVAHPFRS